MLWYDSNESGEWLAATRAGCLVAVRGDGTRETAERLWASLDGGAQGILDGLTSAGLFATPAFALLTWDDHAGTGITGRAILRGDVFLRLTGANDHVAISGLDVSTWREQSFAAVAELIVECGEPGDVPSPLPALPLASGLVRARRLRFLASVLVPQVLVTPAAPIPVEGESVATFSEETISDGAISEEAISEKTIAEETIADHTIAARPFAHEPVTDETTAAVSGYDHLFGATMMRGVEQAAVRPVDADADAEREAGADGEGDAGVDDFDTDRHDGLTVLSGDIRKLRDSRRSARLLPEAAVALPPVMYLLLPNGVREPLGQPIVVGRAPGVSKVSGGQIPRLVSLGGADQDISRNHVRFTVEGDTVVVTDLDSRNGTLIVLPGKPPQKLRGGESTSVIVGTVVDLGGGVTLAVCLDAGER